LNDLKADLQRLREKNLYRSRRLLDGPQGVRPLIDGRRMLSFCSNDYLGLAAHPDLIAALGDGAERYGVGSGAAHLVSGHTGMRTAAWRKPLQPSLADLGPCCSPPVIWRISGSSRRWLEGAVGCLRID
jgi:hypothetical protein